MNDGPVRIKDALAPLGRKLGFRSPAEAARVFSRWKDVVGDGVAAHAHPSSLKGGVLRIVAESSVWANEISYLSEEIKTRANKVAGAQVVSEVRVWTGRAGATASQGDGRTQSAESKEGRSDRGTARASKPSPDGPEEALARARNAWSEARLRADRSATQNRERRR